MNCPCKGCICHPVCMNKETIYCDLLDKEALEVEALVEQIAIDEEDKDRLFQNWWSFIHDFLPKASFIRKCDGTYKRN